MFTGLVEDVGKLVSFKTTDSGGVLEIESKISTHDLVSGESIAVNGVCLTLTKFSKESLLFDVLQETLEKTNITKYRPGDFLNIERALKVGSRLGGHFVQGHVDTTGEVVYNGMKSGEWQLSIKIKDKSHMKFIVDKGSVSIDGVSLTVAKIDGSMFSVCLIPETRDRTILVRRKAGEGVNLEFDMIGKYILSFLENRTANNKSSVTMKTLMEKGFL